MHALFGSKMSDPHRATFNSGLQLLPEVQRLCKAASVWHGCQAVPAISNLAKREGQLLAHCDLSSSPCLQQRRFGHVEVLYARQLQLPRPRHLPTPGSKLVESSLERSRIKSEWRKLVVLRHEAVFVPELAVLLWSLQCHGALWLRSSSRDVCRPGQALMGSYVGASIHYWLSGMLTQ